MLSPIKVEENTFHCTHESSWPPVHAQFDDETLRKMSEAVYEQVKVWRRVCGLDKMDPGKCLDCPLVLRETPSGLVPINKANPVDRVPLTAIGRFGKQRG